MTRLVPHDIDYQVLKNIDLGLSWLLKISAILAIAVLLLDLTKVFPSNNAFLQVLLNSIICIIALLYFLTDLSFSYVFQLAETKRRKDFIDNSLGTSLADVNSVGYFSNDNIGSGILKMGVNSFENSLFSKTVASKMLWPMILKTIFVIVLFLGLALFTNNKVITTVLQLSLPLTVVQQTINLYMYQVRVEKIYETFKTIFSHPASPERDNLLVNNVIDYESTLAWGTILLDSKIFKEVNPSLSITWDGIKNRLNL